MQKWIAGLLCGCGATVPMTIAMETMFHQLPWWARYPLPPRLITMQVAKSLEMESQLDEASRRKLTLAAHLGYGAAMGVIYTTTAQRFVPGIVGGMVFGLGVWAGSYLAALPALGLHAPATSEPASRNSLMIAAHLLWGAVLGRALEGLLPASRRNEQG